jgi:hypothetical protein
MAADGFQGWQTLLLCGIAAVGLVIAIPVIAARYGRDTRQGRALLIAAAAASAYFLCSGGWGAWDQWQYYNRLLSAYRQGDYTVTDGQFSSFHPQFEGHGESSFNVGNRRFAYWSARETPAFHDDHRLVSLNGGERLTVISVGPDIVRIELER